MTKRENIITEIKNFITAQVNEMTYSEYEDLCHGDGLLGIADKAISNTISVYRILIPDTEEIINNFDDETWNDIHRHLDEQVSLLINKTYTDVLGYRLMTKQVLTDISDMSSLIRCTLTNPNEYLGKFKAYVDLYTQCANTLFDEFYTERQGIKDSMQTLLTHLQETVQYSDDDMSDVFNDYINDFYDVTERILNNYREKYDYNNTDDFIEAMHDFQLDSIEEKLITTIYYSTVNSKQD